MDKAVEKPWGWEYLLYENEHIAIWHLHIYEGRQSSLHCHPNKKTGLIVLSGVAEVSFLTDYVEQRGGQRIFPKEKVMIRKGVFHSTKAIVGDLDLFEIETPVDKQDLVRLEDKYGREGKPYEDETHYISKDILQCFPDLSDAVYDHRTNTKIVRGTIDNIKPHEAIERPIVVVTKGNIVSNQGIKIVGPGDVLYKKNMETMISKFKIESEIEYLGIDHGTF